MSRKPNPEARKNILETAHRLYYERGCRGVSMDEIAAAAGIKKANLFHYYRTKEDLALAVCNYGSGCMKDSVQKRFSKGGRDPIRVVEDMFSDIAAAMKGDNCTKGCFVGNIAQEISGQNEKLRNALYDGFRFWIEQLTVFLERHKARGFFKKDLQSGETAEAILSLFEGSILFSKASKRVSAIGNARRMAAAHLKFFKR